MPEMTPNITVSNRTYDKLKPIAGIWLPALATFYTALAAIWGFPYGEQVVGTIVALDLLLGTVLGISTKNHNELVENAREKELDAETAGTLVLNHTDAEADNFMVEFSQDPFELEGLEEVRFKVRTDSQPNPGL